MNTSPSAGPPSRDQDGCQLSDHETTVIEQARQLAGLSGPAAVRARYGTTAVSYASTAHAYAEVFAQATAVIGELLDIIGRLGVVTADDDLRSAANWVFRGIADENVQVRGLKLARDRENA